MPDGTGVIMEDKSSTWVNWSLLVEYDLNHDRNGSLKPAVLNATNDQHDWKHSQNQWKIT